MEVIAIIIIVASSAIAFVAVYFLGFFGGERNYAKEENAAVVKRARELRCEDEYMEIEEEVFQRSGRRNTKAEEV